MTTEPTQPGGPPLTATLHIRPDTEVAVTDLPQVGQVAVLLGGGVTLLGAPVDMVRVLATAQATVLRALRVEAVH